MSLKIIFLNFLDIIIIFIMRIIFPSNIDIKSFIKIKNIVYSQQADQIKLIKLL